MFYKSFNKYLKIIFVYQVASFWPSWDSLYQSCINDAQIEVKLFRIDGSEGDKAQMDDSDVFLRTNNIEFEEFSYEKVMEFSPDYMIYQTPYDKGHRPIETWTARYRKEGIRIVYIPYGIEISDTLESRYKHFSLSVVLNAFSIFVMSDAIKREYDYYCINSDAVKPLGLPRFDSLQHEFPIPDSYKERIDGRKVILWKSHFPKIFVVGNEKKQATPELDEYIHFLQYIRKSQDLFFVFMPHPKFADHTIDFELLPKAKYILCALRSMSNVYIDDSDDYRYSLKNADAIIIDRSAVMVEAGINNVPVLYMYNSNYTEPMTSPIQALLDSYYQGTTADEMIHFCEMVKKGEDKKKLIRKKIFKKCVQFTDGRCADRIKKCLIEDASQESKNTMVHEIQPYSKILLFGAGDIGCYCINTTSSCEKKVNIVGFIDNNQKRWKEQYMGYSIFPPDVLLNIKYDYIVIATDKYYREFYTQLKNLGVPQEKIVNFDQFIVLMRY